MTFVNELEQLRGFCPENDARAAKPSRLAFDMPLSKGNSAFNPPTGDKQIHTHNSSIYNPLQQERQARIRPSQRSKLKAFNRIPAPISDVRNMNLRQLDFV